MMREYTLLFFLLNILFYLPLDAKHCDESTQGTGLAYYATDKNIDCLHIEENVVDAQKIEQSFREKNQKSLHLFSHGKSGELLLNNEWKTPKEIAQWISHTYHLPSRQQLNIYGCEFAKGAKGKAAVAYLESELGLCVAASDDITGADGDWELEIGNITYDTFALEEYAHNLQCPDEVKMYDMRSVTTFAQTDELVLCGAPDTLAFLFFSTAPTNLLGVNMELNLPPGLEYAGFVEGFYAGNIINESDVSNPENPKFLVPFLAPQSVFMAYIGVRANCDLNINESSAKINVDLSYVYVDALGQFNKCTNSYAPLAEFNSEFKLPILNVLEVKDQADADANIILTDNATAGCHDITISQDGIGAYVNDFVFTVDGLDTDNFAIASMTIAGMPFTGYTYDAATDQLTAIIDNPYFIGNSDPNNLPPDELFNENESVMVSICYTAVDCADAATQFLTYGATYGCDDKLCSQPSTKEGSMEFRPDFGAIPTAVNSSLDQAGAFCGNQLIWSTNISSANADPEEGLWQDIILNWNACNGGNTQTADVQINGVSVPFIINAGGDVQVDLTANTTPIPGLADIDGDGFIDDLAGGQTIALKTFVDVICIGADVEQCLSAACMIERVELIFKRNCGQDDQDFCALTPPISWGYGETSFATNEDELDEQGVAVTETMTSGTCSTWPAFNDGFSLQYEYGSNNISGCDGSIVYAEVTITGTLGNMGVNNVGPAGFENAFKSEWVDIRYADGSATYQGAPVAGTTWAYTLDGSGDTTGIKILIPMGDPNAISHDYFFNLEINGHCSPPDYIFTNWQIKEECPNCNGGDCVVLRSCHDVTTRLIWDGTECECECYFYAGVSLFERTNYGYADCAKTQRLTKDQVEPIDLARLMPGDTVRQRNYYAILPGGAAVLADADQSWNFRNIWRGTTGQIIPDLSNSTLVGFYHKKPGQAETLFTPQCILDNTGVSDPHNGVRVDLSNYGVDHAYADESGCVWNDGDTWYSNASAQFPFGMTDANCGAGAVDPVTGYTGSGNGLPAPGYATYRGLNTRFIDTEDQRLNLVWGQGCNLPTGYDPAACLAQTMADYNVADGDTFFIETLIPVITNPYADQSVGLSQSDHFIHPSFGAYQRNPLDCNKTQLLEGACVDFFSFEGHNPETATTTDVVVEDCTVSVEHTFFISNDLPEANDALPAWYANEYRCAIGVDWIEPFFPANLVFDGNMVIELPDGSEIPVPAQYIDDSYGNLNCISDGAGGMCCAAADGSQLASMRIVDQMYLDGLARECNDILTYNENLANKPMDPFPLLAVGGSEACSWKLKYTLTALCPEAIESAQFGLNAQFTDPLINDYFTIRHRVDSTHPDWTTLLAQGLVPYPYHQSGEVESTCGDGNPDDGSMDLLFWPFGIDPDEYADHPGREQWSETTTPDNFVDNSSGNYPPLIPNISQTLISDLAGENEVVTYQICAGTAGDATHTNVSTSISIPSVVQFINVLDAGGANIPATLISNDGTTSVYQVNMADLPPNTCIDIQVVTELLFCPVGTDLDTEICISTVSGCIAAEKAALIAANGGACNESEACYQYIKEEAEIQADWIQPIDAEDFGLCDTIVFEVRIKNVRPSVLIDIDPKFYLPAGLDFVPGSWESAYAGGPTTFGTWTSIVDPTYIGILPLGKAYEFPTTSDFSTDVGASGLPGVTADAATTDVNKVSIRFKAVTACDEFVSGSVPRLYITAADPCESTISTPVLESIPIVINEADPNQYAKMLTFADPTDIQCGSTATVNITSVNISPFDVTTEASRMCVTFPPGEISYVSGSINYTTPVGFPPNATETVSADSMLVCFDVPDGIGQGEQFSVAMEVDLDENVDCGTQQIGIDIQSYLENRLCTATNTDCDVYVLNSVNPLVNVEFAPPLSVPEFQLSLACGTDPDNVTIDYSFELENPGAIYTDDITISAVRDLNNDGIIDSFDPVIATQTQSVTLATGEIITVSGQLSIPENQACPILFDIQQNSTCTCDHLTFEVTEIPPTFFADLGDKQVLCPDDDLTIDICGDYDYALNPSNGGTLSLDLTNQTLGIALNDGFGIDSPVVLEVTGAIGGCGNVFNLNIYQLEDFELGPYSEIVCSDECTSLDLDLPTEIADIATIVWSPADFLSDPTAESPEVCNPTADITYTVTVTLNTGDVGCSKEVSFPITVENPVLENTLTDGELCPGQDDSETLTAPAGYGNYNWYQDVNGNPLPVQAGPNNTYVATATGTYWVEYFDNGDVCDHRSNNIVIIDAPLPPTAPIELEACDNNDGTGDFVLSDADATVDVDGGNAITYHATLADAEAGANALAVPYNAADQTIVYARVVNAFGCYATAEVTLKLLDSAILEPSNIEECDLGDGSAEFDLSGVSFYYTTLADAQTETNPLAAQHTSSGEVIYIRVNATNGCFTIREVTLVVLPLPQVVDADFEVCDSGDGTADFVLSDADALVDVAGGNTITYHSTQLQAFQNISPVASPYNSAGGEMLWARVSDDKGCMSVAEVTLVVNPLPNIATTSLEACDNGDGSADFTLSSTNTDIDVDGGNIVSYHASDADAIANVNAFPDPYTTAATSLFARVTDAKGCFRTIEITLVILPLPEVANAELHGCDYGNGTVDFTLSEADPMVDVAATNTVTYHASAADASTAANPIASPYPSTGGETLYAAVLGENGCIKVAEVALFVETPPLATPYELLACDNGDGTADFNLTMADSNVDTDGDNTVTYYTSQADAEADQNPLVSPFNAPNGTIYARVTDEYGCYTVVPLTITVQTSPILVNTELEECDRGDGQAEFDLTGAGISYYPTLADAEAETNPLSASFVGTDGATIYSRANSTNGCYIIAEVLLTVLPLPNTANTSYFICDTDNDGTEDISFSDADALVDLDGGNTVTYHSTELDAFNGSAALSSPYTTTGGKVFVRVENSDGCFSLAELILELVPLPDAQPASAEVCAEAADGTATFDLSAFDATVDPSASYAITYHATQGDAEGALNPVASPYNTAGGSIFARVEGEHGCYNVAEITLVVEAAPILEDSELTECDNGTGMAEFDLSIGTGTYYLTLADAEAQTNAITEEVYLAESGVLYLRVNSSNNCYDIATITLTVLPLPEIAPAELPACDTGDGTATFDLTSATSIVDPAGGNTVTFHESAIQAALGLTPIPDPSSHPDEAGVVYVRVESPEGCFGLTEINLVIEPCTICPAPRCLPVTITKK